MKIYKEDTTKATEDQINEEDSKPKDIKFRESLDDDNNSGVKITGLNDRATKPLI